MYDYWELYIFKLHGGAYYLISQHEGGEKEAWKEISRVLSCREEIARKRCFLVKDINHAQKVIKLKA